ncbi:MAG: PilZ domain-containing protein [Candidatus Sulfotelmatobacter sp.]
MGEHSISVKVLLVSQDIQTIETLCHFMAQAGMYVEVCSDVISATRKLCHTKFEGVAIDFKERTHALELLAKLHKMTSHGGAVVLAILDRNEDVPSTFRSGANFILERPFAPRLLGATLRASYSLMLQERRRYFRCPVEMPVHVTIAGSNRELVATSVNISERGMALATTVPLRVGEKLQLKMTLPGTNQSARVSGEVCWSDDSGRVGIQFLQVAPEVTDLLRSWLFDRLQESLAEAVLASRDG